MAGQKKAVGWDWMTRARHTGFIGLRRDRSWSKEVSSLSQKRWDGKWYRSRGSLMKPRVLMNLRKGQKNQIRAKICHNPPHQSRNPYILRNQTTYHNQWHPKKKSKVVEENRCERNPYIFGEFETAKMRLQCH